MANIVEKSWLESIYSSINNIITNYTKEMTTIANPTNTKITATDVNNLFNKLKTMKNDYYLSTEPSLFVSYVSVSSGSLISTTTKNLLDTQVENFSSIKCKNSWTKSNTLNSHGNCSHGVRNSGKVVGCSSNCGQEYQKDNEDGYIKSIVCNFDHVCTQTCSSNGTNSHTYKSHETGIDILNSHQPNQSS